MSIVHSYYEDGWCVFDRDPRLMRWVDATLPVAREVVAAPENQEWLRCGDTWFAGVNVLTNDANGKVPAVWLSKVMRLISFGRTLGLTV